MSSERRNTSPADIAVSCEQLIVRYGQVRAVDGVSFEVRRGEVFGLLGPNGAGKTSVVRALSTIIDPAGGEVLISGIPLSDPTGVRQVIGVLPESNGYPEGITAFDYLWYFGRLYGLSSAESTDRADSLLDDLGLAAAADGKIRTFSRGMRQRLGIARALVNRPAVLFLDEPTLGLDPAGREDVLARLTELASVEGTSVVLCSHLLDDVERVCDRLAILHRGRIVASGTVADVVGAADLSRDVAVRVEPPRVEAAVTIIDAQPGVVHRVHADPNDGLIEFSLQEPTQDINGLLAALIQGGVVIREVRREAPRLSDAFLALTSDNGPTR